MDNSLTYCSLKSQLWWVNASFPKTIFLYAPNYCLSSISTNIWHLTAVQDKTSLNTKKWIFHIKMNLTDITICLFECYIWGLNIPVLNKMWITKILYLEFSFLTIVCLVSLCTGNCGTCLFLWLVIVEFKGLYNVNTC